MRKFVVLAVLSMALGLQVWTAYSEELPKAKVLDVTGQVRFKAPEETEWKIVETGIELGQGVQIFVGSDSNCQLALGKDQKSIALLKQDTKATLTAIGDDVRIDVSSGHIFSLIRGMKKGSSFKMASPTAIASARGSAAELAAGDISTSVNVYEHTFGVGAVDGANETPVTEGHGVELDATGAITKEFELSPEVMKNGQDFIQQATDILKETLDQKPVEIPAVNTDANKPKEEDDKKTVGGPNPPNPPSDGPDQGPGPDHGGPGPNVDSAMDGVMQTMAGESEMAHDDGFSAGSMTHTVANLSDLSYGTPGSANAPANGSTPPPGAFNNAMQSAFQQSEFFQHQPPQAQQQMMAYMANYSANNPQGSGNTAGLPPMVPPPNNGGIVPPNVPGNYAGSTPPPVGTLPPPTNFPNFPNNNPYNTSAGNFNPFPNGTNYYNPADNPNFQNTYNPPPVPPPTFIDFISRMRNDYLQYSSAHAGNMSGYFGSPQTAQFNFVQNGANMNGSIVYTPVPDTDFGTTGNQPYHQHGDEFSIHIQDVAVYSDPGGSGTVVLSPTSGSNPIVEVNVPPPGP